jgi:LacI family transcriptional regulator
MDNRAAGETAAYLIGEWLGAAKAKILATLSSNRFRGEEEREIGFRRPLRTRYPNLGLVEASEGLASIGRRGRSCARRSPPIPTSSAPIRSVAETAP